MGTASPAREHPCDVLCPACGRKFKSLSSQGWARGPEGWRVTACGSCYWAEPETGQLPLALGMLGT